MSENGGGNILYITGGKSNIQKATTKQGWNKRFIKQNIEESSKYIQ
jgi:hypothetical protein